jgi:16S rRNA U516 pseudouridylate synthase RsuA-like enzyme
MMEALWRKVILLRRIRVGPLRLGTLGSGAFRELTEEEVAALYAAARSAVPGSR